MEENIKQFKITRKFKNKTKEIFVPKRLCRKGRKSKTKNIFSKSPDLKDHKLPLKFGINRVEHEVCSLNNDLEAVKNLQNIKAVPLSSCSFRNYKHSIDSRIVPTLSKNESKERSFDYRVMNSQYGPTSSNMKLTNFFDHLK